MSQGATEPTQLGRLLRQVEDALAHVRRIYTRLKKQDTLGRPKRRSRQKDGGQQVTPTPTVRVRVGAAVTSVEASAKMKLALSGDEKNGLVFAKQPILIAVASASGANLYEGLAGYAAFNVVGGFVVHVHFAPHTEVLAVRTATDLGTARK